MPSSAATTQIQDPAGTYRCRKRDGSDNRDADPAGTYSAAGAAAPTTDPAGTYSAAGAATATTDPAGTYSGAGKRRRHDHRPSRHLLCRRRSGSDDRSGRQLLRCRARQAADRPIQPAPTPLRASAAAPTTDPAGTYTAAGAAAPTPFPTGALSNLNQTYSGLPESATATIAGLGASSFTFTYNGSATAPTAAGSYTVAATLVNANYQGSATGTLVIAQAPLTITAKNAAKTYYAINPSFTASYSGFVPGESAASLTTAPSLGTTATTTSNVGNYPITASGAGDPNYYISYVGGTLTINPITLTASGTNFAVLAGTSVTATVASFPNLDPVGTINSYTATISWGDGTASSAGVIANAGGGVFTVTGTHAYSNSGSDHFTVTIAHVLGNTTTAVATGVATVTPKTGSITGHVYQDLTGNGMTSDDTGLAGITVYIDANKNGSLNSGDPTAVTDGNGAYTFTGLVAGTYVVRESLPSSYISTGPALADNYTVAVTAGANSTGNDFDDFRLLNTSVISNIKYTINGTSSVSDLRGNTDQGDLVQVTFTVAANVTNFPVSLVSYTAPGCYLRRQPPRRHSSKSSNLRRRHVPRPAPTH